MKKPLGFIADIHAHAYKNHSYTLPDGINSRLKVILDATYNAALKLKEVGGETLFIAGDVFHVRGSIKPSVFNAFADTLAQIGNLGIKVVIIPGNHDMENLNNGATAVDTLQSINGVTVYKSPAASCIDGWNVVLFPYINSTEAFKEEVKKVCWSVDVIVCHQGIDNFKPNAAMPDCGVTAQWLIDNTKAKVFAGHYHHSRNYQSIVSIGAIAQHDFSSEGENRGMWFLYPDGNREFFPILSPRFITIDATGRKIPKTEDVSGNYVRILAKTIATANKVRDVVESAGAASVVVHIEKEFTKSKTETIKVSNPETMISQFIDINSPKYDAIKPLILDAYRSLP